MLRIVTLLAWIAAAAVANASIGAEAKFQDIFANPAAYNHKRVTLTGLADVGGDALWVWRDARAWRQKEDTGAIFIACHFPAAADVLPYAYANARFVKVTGTIDTSIHGHLGTDPFSLVLEHLEVLSGPRLKELLPILGLFRNDTSATVHVKISRADGYSVFDLRPKSQAVEGLEKGTVVVTAPSGKMIAKCTLLPSKRYYDAAKKAYYFRIIGDRIQTLRPEDASGWRLGSWPDRT